MAGTIHERMKSVFDTLTRAERQLTDTILENYPMSGLGSITRLAESAGVSTPTVARMVQKLGYSGFPDFQEALRGELEARFSDPIAKHENWTQTAPQGHIINRFADVATQNIRQTLAHIDPEQFDRVTGLLADERHNVFIAGGRITHALSDYFHMHMQVMRKGVVHIRSTSNAWPHSLLDVGADDVVVIYDIRRYENSTLKLAEMASRRGATIVLITDQWQSPIREHAQYTFSCRIEAPSAWDSTITLMLLTETLIAAIQEASWERTKLRMNELEDMFDHTRIFRKFV